MAQATIMTEEQMNIISSDIAALIQRLEQLNKNSEALNLEDIVKKEIRQAIKDQAVYEHLQRADLELEDNLQELLKVKNMFYTMRKSDIVSNIIVILATIAVTVPVTVLAFKFLA
jgi:hypothetical protein